MVSTQLFGLAQCIRPRHGVMHQQAICKIFLDVPHCRPSILCGHLAAKDRQPQIIEPILLASFWFSDPNLPLLPVLTGARPSSHPPLFPRAAILWCSLAGASRPRRALIASMHCGFPPYRFAGHLEQSDETLDQPKTRYAVRCQQGDPRASCRHAPCQIVRLPPVLLVVFALQPALCSRKRQHIRQRLR